MLTMTFTRLLPFAVLCASLGATALAQTSQEADVPWRAIHGVPLDASLPRLVAEGWQVVAVSHRDQTFAYHLVREGVLALCLADIGAIPPGTECMRLADGPASSPAGGDRGAKP